MHGGVIKRSQLYFILSFLVLIASGMLILRLPFMTREGTPVAGWLDALFTSTSAVCVTGLTTLPMSSFSAVGQVVILLLIQLGGLGIMTLSASILIMLGREMSVSNTIMLSTINSSPFSTTEGLLRTVFRYTIFTEIIGAVLLLPGFWADGKGLGEALYYSIFHSISAFCNAGFSPMNESLCSSGSWVKTVVAGLIIMGGIGVYVIYDITMKFNERTRRLRVHTKLVITVTLILLISGMLLLKVFNWHSLKWIDAFFQSASARTAGFNSVELNTLSMNSIMVIIILMLIGAAPGSTGGGMKIAAVGLAAAAMISILKGNRYTLIFKRKIPTTMVLRSFTIVVIYLLAAVIGLVLLMSCLPGEFLHKAFFEVVSALGTVGMSLGSTMRLNGWGKVLIVVYMFIGRVGPFTLMLFLLGREKNSKLSYPEEKIILG